ncbi:MAG: hypothetical protein AB7O45_02935 [Alphaproteobacteria bacterium]
MTLAELKASIAADRPPEGAGDALAALWWAAKGDWDRAHHHAQQDESADGAWVHAHLHRIEGDLSNAGGWYQRAGKPAADGPLAEEWDRIAESLL